MGKPNAAARSQGDDFAITITGPDLVELLNAAKGADKKIATELRKAIRKAAEDAVGDVKREIGNIPSKSGGGAVRAALQAGTRVQILASSPRTAGVKIITTGAKLPAKKKPLVRAMNRPTFRHPVFANPKHVRSLTKDQRLENKWLAARGRGGEKHKSWTWVEQQGHPYFDAVLDGRGPQIQTEIAAAAQRAADQIAQALEAANRE